MSMDDVRLTVVITTYNRPVLVERAIASAVRQAAKVLVVNDGSSCQADYDALASKWPMARFVHLPENSGAQHARNVGLDACDTDLALILDDDDQLRPGAIREAVGIISEFGLEYPVYSFACSNGTIDVPHRLVSHIDYLDGNISGDFTPVFNLRHPARVRYPVISGLRVGTEHLLWLAVGFEHNIPTWRDCRLVEVGSSATERLTSPRLFVRRASEFAQLQSLIVEQLVSHGWHLESPRAYRKRVIAWLLYSLAAGERYQAERALRHLPLTERLALRPLLVVPAAVHRALLYHGKRFQLRKTHSVD